MVIGEGASASQAEGREFDPRLPIQPQHLMVGAATSAASPLPESVTACERSASVASPLKKHRESWLRLTNINDGGGDRFSNPYLLLMLTS